MIQQITPPSLKIDNQLVTNSILLVDCHCFDYGESQGINTYIKGLYQALIPKAPDIQFIIAAQRTERMKSIFGSHSNLDYLPLGRHSKYYRLLLEYPRIIKDNNVDFAHFQYTIPLIKNCKAIVTLHDILFEDFPQYFSKGYRWSKHLLFKTSAERADLLLTVSDYSKDRISFHYQIPKDKIVVTPNAVNPDFGKRNHFQDREFIKKRYRINDYILYVSRFEPRKNQHGLLKAYKDGKIWEKGKDLVFIGNRSLPVPDFEKELETMPEVGRKRVHLFENIPYEELLSWYGGADLYVYPSFAEGFGIPAIEAGATGIPTLCNNQTAMEDFDFFKTNHIDTSNQTLLKERMVTLLDAKPSSSEELQQIKKDIYSKYNWDNIAESYYNTLKAIF